MQNIIFPGAFGTCAVIFCRKPLCRPVQNIQEYLSLLERTKSANSLQCSALYRSFWKFTLGSWWTWWTSVSFFITGCLKQVHTSMGKPLLCTLVLWTILAQCLNSRFESVSDVHPRCWQSKVHAVSTIVPLKKKLFTGSEFEIICLGWTLSTQNILNPMNVIKDTYTTG